MKQNAMTLKLYEDILLQLLNPIHSNYKVDVSLERVSSK
jgi:hypothetical protein